MARPVARRGEGRERVLDAAVQLFAEHGVSGTSLQMIAAALGVTKAAVYYQFQSKEDIVLEAVRSATEQMSAFISAAEAQPSRAAQLDVTLEGLVSLVVSHRRVTAVLWGDPGMAEVIDTHEELRALDERLTRLLTGPNPTASDRVAVAVLAGGLTLAGADPLADLDDDTLREELLRCARALLRPGRRGRGGRS